MMIWFDPDINPNDSTWVWVKREQGILNWIAAEPRAVSIPKGEQFDHLAAAAKQYTVKCARH